MKKYIPVLLAALVFAACILCACGTEISQSEDNSPENYSQEEKVFYEEGSPVPSLMPGVYYEEQTVSVTAADGLKIYYTLTGAEPTTKSQEYTEPIKIEAKDTDDNSKVTVYNFRFAAFDSNGNKVGNTVTASYILPKFKDRFTTKVISVVTDPNNLYGTDGIFTNYNNKGRASERETTFSIYGYDGTLEAMQNLGMRVNGTGSRGNAQKNLRFFARRDYSPLTGHFKANLFPGLLSDNTSTQIDEFDTFLVRGGASNFGNTLITNLVAYEIFDGTNVDSGSFEPVSVFINGTYYGMMMLCEDYSPYYFESRYGIPSEQIATINYTVTDDGLAWEFDDGNTAEDEEWHQVRRYMYINDMSNPENYKMACSYMDMDNFIDYIITECYLNNWDWPRNNVRVWRYTGVETSNSLTQVEGVGGYDADASYGYDGKWRFLAKDLDIVMGVTVSKEKGYASTVDQDFFEILNKDDYSNHRLDVMFNSLMNNAEFKEKFVTRLCELMSTNLSKENCLEIINRLELQVAEELGYHSETFGETLEYWDYTIQWMRDFAENRAKYVQNSMKSGIGVTVKQLQVKGFTGGTVTVNGCTLDGSGLVYVPAGYDLDITFTPDEGYEFSSCKTFGCSITDNSVLTINKSGSASITPVFTEKANTEEPASENKLCINEIGHSTSEAVNGSDWIELYNPTDAEINLKGYTVSDGEKSFAFGNITVEAKGYKVLICDGSETGGVYIPFRLSDNETITLADSEGNIIDTVAIIISDNSNHIGRYPDGGEFTELSKYEITPGCENIHSTETSHTYDDCNYNTVLFNGWLVDSEFFSVDGEGNLTITMGKLKALYDEYLALLELDAKVEGNKASESLTMAKNYMNRVEKKHGDGDVITVTKLVSYFTSDTKVYYLDDFNTYVICTCHEQNVA